MAMRLRHNGLTLHSGVGATQTDFKWTHGMLSA